MSEGALSGIRIIDFTWVGVGPFATKFLADFGADVIKVESSKKVDLIRTMRPAAGGQQGVNRSGYFANRNSSKRSITLDMKNPEALSLVEELLEEADVVINNFSPGVMEKIGLPYEVVKKINPGIVYLDMPMLGIEGPESGFRGFGMMINALSGLYALTGLPGRRPSGPGTNYPDHVPNPLHAATAILAALIARQDTGQGQYIEVAQIESSLNVLGPHIMAYLSSGEEPGPAGNRHPDYTPQGIYRCGNEESCAVTVRTQRHWEKLCEVLDKPEWIGMDVEQRRVDDSVIDLAISDWFETRTAEEALQTLQNYGIPCGKVLDAREVLSDPQLEFQEHWQYLNHQEMGESVYDSPVARLSQTPAELSRPAPLLGEHTKEICEDLLDLNEQRTEELKDKGVFR